MQRLRDKSIVLGVKDAEWQRSITLARSQQQQHQQDNVNQIFSPRRNIIDQYNNLYRDDRLYLTTPPKNLPLPTDVTQLPQNYSIPPGLRNNPAIQLQLDPRQDLDRSQQMLDISKIQSPNTRTRHTDPPVSPGASSTPSASTHAHSPELDDPAEPRPRKKPRSHTRGVGKIRRHRMTKEEEARFDPRDLVDLRGSTAAQSRKMTDRERDVMLHKRRLRNRQSAARSRDKQRKTITDVGEEVDELHTRSEDIRKQCQKVSEDVARLRAVNEALSRELDVLKHENGTLKQENGVLKRELEEIKANATSQSPVMRRSGSTLRFSFSSDMLDRLDKIIGGSTDGLIPNGGDASNIYRIPSRLRLSLSTDKLTDGNPAMSGPLPPLSRNASITDRLLDYGNNNTTNNNNIDNLELNADLEVKKE